MGLRPEITSVEQFMAVVEEQAILARDELGRLPEVTPNAGMLKEIHHTIFEKVLHDPGEFRQESVGDKTDHQLDELARKHHDLLSVARDEHERGLALNEGETVKKLADYHSELMRIKPFTDVEGGNFINRTVALIVLEAQIRHCIPAYKYENQKPLSNATYEQAIAWSHESGLPHKLEEVVKDLAGQPDNVRYLADHRRQQEDGQSY